MLQYSPHFGGRNCSLRIFSNGIRSQAKTLLENIIEMLGSRVAQFEGYLGGRLSRIHKILVGK